MYVDEQFTEAFLDIDIGKVGWTVWVARVEVDLLTLKACAEILKLFTFLQNSNNGRPGVPNPKPPHSHDNPKCKNLILFDPIQHGSLVLSADNVFIIFLHCQQLKKMAPGIINAHKVAPTRKKKDLR